MKINLRSKLFLSYVFVILITLILLSWLVDTQMNQHFQIFYENFDYDSVPNALVPPRAPGQNFLDAMHQSTILTVIGAGIFAIFISFMITGYITKPVKKLIDATKAIALGKYTERVPIESNDELGELTKSLNSMAKSLENHRYLQQQLITNVSHELATPLTNIGGYLEALMDQMIKEKGREEAYVLMKEEVDRLKNMLDEVRALSMFEQPQFKINPTLVHVKDLTLKIIKQIQAQFDRKNIPLSFKSNLKSEKFVLDKDRYTQILLNILNNALKYSSKNKPVLVEISDSDKELVVKIEDHGDGIPEKELPFIFERFYRTDKSRDRKTGGIGVGLSIVRELVEAHGGEITVASKEGEGSTFTVHFPI